MSSLLTTCDDCAEICLEECEDIVLEGDWLVALAEYTWHLTTPSGAHYTGVATTDAYGVLTIPEDLFPEGLFYQGSDPVTITFTDIVSVQVMIEDAIGDHDCIRISFGCVPTTVPFDFGLNDTYCLADPFFILDNPNNGIYSGAPVFDGGGGVYYFDPATSGPGTFVITYTLNTFVATFTVTILDIPVVTLAPFADVNLLTPTFALFGGSPLGGVYLVDGVETTFFDPADAGAGAYEIQYYYPCYEAGGGTYAETGCCNNFAIENLTVIAEVEGCTDPLAINYNPIATIDDGSCIILPPEVEGCTDELAENYNPLATVDDGSCTYPPPVGLVPIQTKLGHTFYGENHLGFQNNVTRITGPTTFQKHVDLRFGAWFLIREPGYIATADVTALNNFIDIAGGDLICYLGLEWDARPYDNDAMIDSLIAAFGGRLKAMQLLDESNLTGQLYKARAEHARDVIAGRVLEILDIGSMFHTAGQWTNPVTGRWPNCATITGVDDGRIYFNLENQITWVANMATNVANSKNYWNVLAVNDHNKWPTVLPNLQYRAVMNFLMERPKPPPQLMYVRGTPLSNINIGKGVEFVLKHTDGYRYLMWLGNLLDTGGNPVPDYDSLFRVSPLFHFEFVEPYSFGITDVTGVKVFNSDGTAALLINNFSDLQHTITAASVPGNVGNFITITQGYAPTSWNDTTVNESLSDLAVLTLRPRGVCVAYYQGAVP